MPNQAVPQVVFNRGLVSPRATARTDVERVRMAAVEMRNWRPEQLGAMAIRPGTSHLGSAFDGVKIPFVYATDEASLLELGNGSMRIWDGGDTLLRRPEVSTILQNPEFTNNLNGWLSDNEPGAAATHEDYNGRGALRLSGSQYSEARVYQRVTLRVADWEKLHALRVSVVSNWGAVTLRVGTSPNADDVLQQVVLRPGEHSIAFMPTDAGPYDAENRRHLFVTLGSRLGYPAYVSRCQFQSGDIVALTTPWNTENRVRNIRWQQVNDVMFCACANVQPHRIERRPYGSWSVVEYQTKVGPHSRINVERTRLNTSGLTGYVTITANAPVFDEGHVRTVWGMPSIGQRITATLPAIGTFTDPIRIVGVGDQRRFNIKISGTWSGTLRLQQSIGSPDNWVNYADTAYTANTAANGIQFNDGLDNVEVYYRVGFNFSYTSGAAVVELFNPQGSIDGSFRIIAVDSPTQARAVVLKPLGGSSDLWSEGAWGRYGGWPTAVALADGRLWWFGQGRAWASVSDDYENFDTTYEGDAAALSKTLGRGGTQRVNWAAALNRLLVGTDDVVQSLRSSSFEEPITPSNFNIKTRSTKGAAAVPPVLTDTSAYFVSGAGDRLLELRYEPGEYDYVAVATDVVVPEVTKSGIRRIAVTSNPDVRVYAVRKDGTLAVLLHDPVEDITCWYDIETDGKVLDVAVLPGPGGDRVFLTVERKLIKDNGTIFISSRHEELLPHSFIGDPAYMLDAAVDFTNLNTLNSTFALSHLDGKDVILMDRLTHKLVGRVRVTNRVIPTAGLPIRFEGRVGLGYEARYRSARVPLPDQAGPTIGRVSRLTHIAFALVDALKLKFGADFETMDDIRMRASSGAPLEVPVPVLDTDPKPFPAGWTLDSRVCLWGEAPYPCTVLGAVTYGDFPPPV